MSNPITIGAYPAPTSSIRIESERYHLANSNFNFAAYPGTPGHLNYFMFGNLTAPERDLLYNYGKVFYYEVEVYDKFTNALLVTTLIHPEIKTLPTGPLPNHDWKPVQDMAGNPLQGYVPGWTNLDLYYYNAGLPTGTIWNGPSGGGHKCDSREIVFDVPYSLNLDERPIPGGSYKLTLNFLQNNFLLWQNSALRLSVTK